MKIKVFRSTDYWKLGTSTKIVPSDEVDLSDELYVCDEKFHDLHIKETRICRLISGIKGNDELGYHFTDGWITVCPINAKYAIFRGVHKSQLQKVDDTNNTLLEILRE